jgi:hypothetical protein
MSHQRYLAGEDTMDEQERLKAEVEMMTEQAFKFRDLCIEKEAEKERLKESLHEAGVRNGKLVQQLREKELVIETMNEAHKHLIAQKKVLITELCDALEAKTSCVEYWDIGLIQRAREATK